MKTVINENKLILVKEDELGYVEFNKLENNVLEINKTIVNEKYQGQGIASKLMEELTKYVLDNNFKLYLKCSYAVKWFEKHNEYMSLLI